jgi:hypothetical protein
VERRRQRQMCIRDSRYSLTDDEKLKLDTQEYIDFTNKCRVSEIEESNTLEEVLAKFSYGQDCVMQYTWEEVISFTPCSNNGCHPSPVTLIDISHILVGEMVCTNNEGSSGGFGENGGSIGTSPHGGTGGGNANKKPCENLSNMANPSGQNIVPSINFLVQKVVNNTPIEWGVDFNKTGPTSLLTQDSQFSYNNNQVQGLSDSVNMTYGPNYAGAAHCHTNNGVGLFSFADVRNLSLAFNAANYNIKKDVTSILVVPNPVSPLSPKVYAIKVDNYTALANAIDAELNDPRYADPNVNIAIRRIHADMAKTMQGSNFEKSFLEKYSNFGISLYKATNNNFDDWSKLKVNPTSLGGIEIVPCLLQKNKNNNKNY